MQSSNLQKETKVDFFDPLPPNFIESNLVQNGSTWKDI